MLIAGIFILLWSSGYIFVENGLHYSDPLAFLSLRLWLAWIIIVAILLYKRPKFPTSLKQFFIIAITGIFMLGLYPVFFFTALHEGISPGILAIILGMQPLLTILIIREAMTRLQIIGILLGFVGLSLTVANSIMSTSNTIFGIGSALLSLSGMTLGTILQKKYCSSFSLTSNLFIQYLASAIMVSILSILLGNLNVIWSVSFTLSLLWIVLVISIGATYLFYTLLKNGKATSVTSYMYCVPPVTAIMDYMIFHHVLSLTTIMGMILVMCGLVMIHYRKSIFLDYKNKKATQKIAHS